LKGTERGEGPAQPAIPGPAGTEDESGKKSAPDVWTQRGTRRGANGQTVGEKALEEQGGGKKRVAQRGGGKKEGCKAPMKSWKINWNFFGTGGKRIKHERGKTPPSIVRKGISVIPAPRWGLDKN